MTAQDQASSRRALQVARLSNRKALQWLLVDWCVIAIAIATAMRFDSVLAYSIALPFIAGRQVAMLNLTHAACHNGLFGSRCLNRALEPLFAFPIFESIATYRGPHLDHHREMAQRADYRFEYLHDYLGLARRGARSRLWAVLIRPSLGFASYDFVYGTVRTIFRNARFAARLLAFWGAVCALAWQFDFAGPFVLLWCVPLLWLYPVFNLWAEVSDHFGTRGPVESRTHYGFFNAVFIKGHERYHELHHRHPSIPFYHHADTVRLFPTTDLDVSRSFLDFIALIYRGRVSVSR